jgi:hypothetical protein
MSHLLPPRHQIKSLLRTSDQQNIRYKAALSRKILVHTELNIPRQAVWASAMSKIHFKLEVQYPEAEGTLQHCYSALGMPLKAWPGKNSSVRTKDVKSNSSSKRKERKKQALQHPYKTENLNTWSDT